LSTPPHNPAYNQPEPSTQPSPWSPPTQTLPIDQPANTATAIYPNVSPLNTHFILPTGDYDAAANGVLWYTASLFSFLPFLQPGPRPTDTQTERVPYRIQSDWIPNRILPDRTDGRSTLLSSRTFARDYNNSAYTTTTLQSTDNVTDDTYCPPWPPPHLFSGLSTNRPFDDFRSDIFWPTRIPPHDSWVPQPSDTTTLTCSQDTSGLLIPTSQATYSA